MTFRQKREQAEEVFVPTLCQRCTSERVARIDYGRHGWLCWDCYEELRAPTVIDQLLADRMANRRAKDD